MRSRFWLMLLVAVGIAGAMLVAGRRRDDKTAAGQRAGTPDHGSWEALRLGANAVADVVTIDARSPIELDSASLDEILRIRVASVKAQAQLFDIGKYEPNPYLFNRIVDGRPWWGLDGLYFYGPGEHAVDGPSRESLWIANPGLVIGVEAKRAYITRLAPDGRPRYPLLERIEWRPRERRVTARYDLTAYFAHLVAIGQRQRLGLVTTNAQDFGLAYIHLDRARSRGIRFAEPPSAHASRLRQFIHVGRSCGRREGCNNRSPATPELEFWVVGHPASLRGRLWRDAPDSVTDSPDLELEIMLDFR